MDRVVFLDRDGTLNEEVHYLHRTEDLKLLAGVPEALCALQRAGYHLVVVTNQAGVGRGYYQEEDVERLHVFMNEQLLKKGACVEHFFYCPHHPTHGIGAYKQVCHCRKPETGMLERAEQYYELDKAHSWLIGDKLIDVEAGSRFGVHTALVGTGYGSQEQKKAQEAGKVPYELYGETLFQIVQEILKKENVDVK